MNFKELATARFSVRKFTDEAVSQADLDAIMTCVQLASVGLQPTALEVSPSRL